jgi:hypothetical protein
MKMKKENFRAEFYLSNGNHIVFYHCYEDIVEMIQEFENAVKEKESYCLSNYSEFIDELYYNGRIINDVNFSFYAPNVDLYKFEG